MLWLPVPGTEGVPVLLRGREAGERDGGRGLGLRATVTPSAA